jgi:Fic family protein
MIHPFRVGNGRMARALQTMVLAQDHVVEPTFSSIEEWLGSNTEEYRRQPLTDPYPTLPEENRRAR